jgi:hypothetical protein
MLAAIGYEADGHKLSIVPCRRSRQLDVLNSSAPFKKDPLILARERKQPESLQSRTESRERNAKNATMRKR